MNRALFVIGIILLSGCLIRGKRADGTEWKIGYAIGEQEEGQQQDGPSRHIANTHSRVSQEQMERKQAHDQALADHRARGLKKKEDRLKAIAQAKKAENAAREEKAKLMRQQGFERMTTRIADLKTECTQCGCSLFYATDKSMQLVKGDNPFMIDKNFTRNSDVDSKYRLLYVGIYDPEKGMEYDQKKNIFASQLYCEEQGKVLATPDQVSLANRLAKMNNDPQSSYNDFWCAAPPVENQKASELIASYQEKHTQLKAACDAQEMAELEAENAANAVITKKMASKECAIAKVQRNYCAKMFMLNHIMENIAHRKRIDNETGTINAYDARRQAAYKIAYQDQLEKVYVELKKMGAKPMKCGSDKQLAIYMTATCGVADPR